MTLLLAVLLSLVNVSYGQDKVHIASQIQIADNVQYNVVGVVQELKEDEPLPNVDKIIEIETSDKPLEPSLISSNVSRLILSTPTVQAITSHVPASLKHSLKNIVISERSKHLAIILGTITFTIKGVQILATKTTLATITDGSFELALMSAYIATFYTAFSTLTAAHIEQLIERTASIPDNLKHQMILSRKLTDKVTLAFEPVYQFGKRLSYDMLIAQVLNAIQLFPHSPLEVASNTIFIDVLSTTWGRIRKEQIDDRFPSDVKSWNSSTHKQYQDITLSSKIFFTLLITITKNLYTFGVMSTTESLVFHGTLYGCLILAQATFGNKMIDTLYKASSNVTNHIKSVSRGIKQLSIAIANTLVPNNPLIHCSLLLDPPKARE